ncbi:hypothetical protein DYBT9623_05111 [Dyadobacter sp. CECT 9623]|uniref:Uncharacterized protein n=1 Tax=Dyadobacter linearis TaxID=2823330 RepID=A0ABN7RIB0_9BACT|nr:hypothetical protein [Dyadobacter sp. CECT 9623]CAG5074428.1 hypothetical protein DYBT9623_05111 [Dyadobacter sp. CECT 9623]
MKKHPVDDLFKRKLNNLEKAPSDNAWLRIREKQVPKRRVMGWVWYAAASTVVGLFGGYLVWQHSQTDVTVTNKQIVAKVQRQDSILPKAVDEKTVKTENTIAAVPKEKIKKESLVVRKAIEEKQVPEQRSLNEINEEQPALAKLETKQPAEKSMNNNTSSSVASLPKVTDWEPVKEENKTAAIAKVEAEPARTIVVAVESESDDPEERPKASKFSKVFRQLKNARAGERVDWEEVGFNPRTLVARVDDRLRSKEDKTSDKYQDSKERTKL